MRKISWCKNQNLGIKLTEPSNNLSEEYYKTAEESLKVLKNIQAIESKVWSATTKYYIEYFAFYSVLMKIGIKCEIHDCTIALAEFFEKEKIIPKGISKTLEEDKELRIDNQYYLKNRPVDIDFDKISGFIISIKETLDSLNKEKIEELRLKLFPEEK